jgi:hypothetical protein
VIGASLEPDGPAGLPRNPRDDAERLVQALEYRSLFDVKLQERIGQLCEPTAAHRPRLLGPEGGDAELRVGKPLGGLDCRDDP